MLALLEAVHVRQHVLVLGPGAMAARRVGICLLSFYLCDAWAIRARGVLPHLCTGTAHMRSCVLNLEPPNWFIYGLMAPGYLLRTPAGGACMGPLLDQEQEPTALEHMDLNCGVEPSVQRLCVFFSSRPHADLKRKFVALRRT